MKRSFIIFSIMLLTVAGGIIGAQNALSQDDATSGHDTALARNLMIFNALVQELENTYVDTIRPDEAFKAAIGAMLNTVDPYTEYYSADDTDALSHMTTGVYGGIGAFVMNMDGNTYISQPIVGTPSYQAGLKAGDRLVQIDTTNVRGKTSEYTTKLLRGDPGTTVRVTVVRPFVADSLLTFDIVRERVQEKSVPYYGVVDGNTGYIRLSSFMEKSADEVKEALESFKANPAVTGVILDLRGNGGGLVESAISILGNFLPKGTEVMQTKGRSPYSVKTYKTTHSPLMPDMPLVVLLDGGSASASEITAGALQDLDRAVLAGSRSFGKGLVQGTRQLPYDGLLKITTAKYYIPSGRLIQALDYSHRNPDGSVARTPDSLANEFLTRNGRIVRDGGGLMPDTIIKHPEYSRLLLNLMMTNQVFNYATKYAATHPSIQPAAEFVVSDEIFEDFVAGIDTAKMVSDKIGKTLVDDLRKAADTEGFMTPELSEALSQLEPLVEPDLKRDLYNKREEIDRFLGEEIVSRYYSEAGVDEYSLRFDPDVKAAVEILNNQELYKTLLGFKDQKKK